MVNKVKFTKSDLMRAIQGNPVAAPPVRFTDDDEDSYIKNEWLNDLRESSHGHIPTIAARLRCSAQTVRNYLNERTRLPEYKVLLGLLRQIRQAIREADSGVFDLVKEMAVINQDDKFQLSDIIEQLLHGLDDRAVKLGPILITIKNNIISNTWGEFTQQAIDLQTAVSEEKEHGLIAQAEIRHEIKTDAQKALHVLVKAFDPSSVRFANERLDKENYSGRSEVTGKDGKDLFTAEHLALLAEVGITPKQFIAAMMEKVSSELAGAEAEPDE